MRSESTGCKFSLVGESQNVAAYLTLLDGYYLPFWMLFLGFSRSEAQVKKLPGKKVDFLGFFDKP